MSLKIPNEIITADDNYDEDDMVEYIKLHKFEVFLYKSYVG
jgi:hypothetical protein